MEYRDNIINEDGKTYLKKHTEREFNPDGTRKKVVKDKTYLNTDTASGSSNSSAAVSGNTTGSNANMTSAEDTLKYNQGLGPKGVPDNEAQPPAGWTPRDNDPANMKDTTATMPPQHTKPATGGTTPPKNNVTKPTEPTPPAPTDPVGPKPGNDWWKFFGSKEFLIAAGAATAIAAIIAAVKALGKTIKSRFQRASKTLYNMQKDFGTAENGMDMKAVLPGQGSKLMDKITKFFSGTKKDRRGAMGLRPFVDNYKSELAQDYKEATKAWNMISVAGESLDDKKGNEQPNANVVDKDKQPATPATESLQEGYASFAAAMRATSLNESEQVNESIAGLVSLASIAMRGGQFLYSKIGKDGKPQGEAVPVQVTQQSTREICYSIMNMFFDKYFDMQAVSQHLGVNVSSLGDIDRSNIDKFTKIAKEMKNQQAEGKVSKMYQRVQREYNAMVDGYGRTAQAIVDNFKKYTTNKGKDASGKPIPLTEKDSNLLVAGYEKLQAEVRRQMDAYKNNFFRVANAINSSPEYLTYLDFITEKVIPVFKSGLASDADYVLDVMPKQGEAYVVRQSNGQDTLNGGQTAKGNVAIAVVKEFDAESKKISFSLVGRITSELQKTNDNEYDLDGVDVDKTAYSKVQGEEGSSDYILDFSKWLALDPVLAVGGEFGKKEKEEDVPVDEESYPKTLLYTRSYTGKDGTAYTQYVFGIIPPEEKNEAADVDASNFDETSVLSEKNDSVTPEETTPTPEPDVEIAPDDTDAAKYHIYKLYACSIKQGNKLSDENNLYSGATIMLTNKPSVEDYAKKMTGLQFVGEEGHYEEKHLIETRNNSQKGYTHINQTIDDLGSLEGVINNISERRTDVEQIVAQGEQIVEQIENAVKTYGLDNINNFTLVNYYGKYRFLWNVKSKNPKAAYSYQTLMQPAANSASQTTNQNSANTVVPENPTAVSDTSTNTNVNSSISTPTVSIQNIMFEDETVNVSNDVPSINEEGSGWLKLGTNILLKDKNGNIAEGNKFYLIMRPFLWTTQNGQPAEYEVSIENVTKNYNKVKADIQKIKFEFGIEIRPSTHYDNKGLADKKYSKFCFDLKNHDNLVKSLKEYLNGLTAAGMIEGGTVQTTNEQAADIENPGIPANTQMDAASFNIEYSDMFNLAESFMGTLTYLKVNRKISAPTDDTYYVLSENAWGDGTMLNPDIYLTNMINEHLKKCHTIDDFNRLAKSSVSINFMQITEDCSYKTSLPYNRYQMLTESNPLYEATAIVTFAKDGAVSNVHNKGISKIVG